MSDAYLDINGSTPVHPAVLEAYLESTRATCGNASVSHPAGLLAQEHIARARATAARTLGCSDDEIWFTSGGTESNNWALKGLFAPHCGGRLVTSAIEHKSVLRTADALARAGIDVAVVPVGNSGRVEVADIERALTPDTRVVSLMVANNETGVLQPVREVAQLCRSRGILLHCDAVAAIGKLPLDVRELGCDLLSLSGHKLYAPKGCGVLYVRRGVALAPLIDGCGQQCGMRSGTENTAAVAALGRAFELLASGAFDAARRPELRDQLWAGVRALEPRAVRNGEGPWLPNTLSVTFPGRIGTELQSALGARGVHCSAGAAAMGSAPSHVLMAMGKGDAHARATLRFSLGHSTRTDDIERALSALADALRATPKPEEAHA
ncbi:MAG: cysteine desulfurase [Planctomycetes bacterium]|nr:cysteine desulfurase [Planctomycetota bacterium]